MSTTSFHILLFLVLTASSWGQPTVEHNDSCVTNFFAMEQSLLQSTENRFNLQNAFHPLQTASPVIVRVNYTFGDDLGDFQLWYWSEAEFYLIQPLEVFQFTSLLFSNMAFRREELLIELNDDCSAASEKFFRTLTTRLQLYSESATTGPLSATQRITNNYRAVAASFKEISRDLFLSSFIKVWLHVILILFPVGTVFMLYLCDPIQQLLGDKTWEKLEDEHTHGTVASLVQISIIFTIFVFALDVTGIYFTVTSDFISYDSNISFYLSTVTGLVIDILALGLVVFFLAKSLLTEFRRNTHICNCAKAKRVKKLISRVMVAPVLCLSNHIHYIILAFISDAHHAGSVAIIYVISTAFVFFIIRQFYNRMILRSNNHPRKVHQPKNTINDSTSTTITDDQNSTPPVSPVCSIEGDTNRRSCHKPFNIRIVIFSLLTIDPLIVVYLGIIFALFFTLPISKSNEDAPSRVYAIYQGTGFIIAGLLTYNILLNPSPFSVPKAVENIANSLQVPKKVGSWDVLTVEEKFAKIISTLLEGRNDRRTHGSNLNSNGRGRSQNNSEHIQITIESTV